ncbi:uncharacterized protein LTR77_002609 [Saxophila tyrrhenica]|uniref:Major facilitator superfamily (MFS) profile domain-containing protein n=1 Tax=Saxophila tyrrhenica TaxID=1690608 RepID=A0AAV9PKB2_9PEZI|nr:hypothetical protein LTR77_002609 [Saxophila tyrrhenica]
MSPHWMDPASHEAQSVVAELDGTAAPTMRLPTPEEEGRRSLSQSSTSSSSSLKKPIAVPRKVSDALEAKGFEVDNTGTVRWAPDSLTHPRRWSLVRKLYDTAVICFLEFFVTLISNTGSSVAPLAADELGLSREWSLFCFTTLYLLGQAIGGLIFSPIAESFGGRTIYLSSTLGYSLFCIAMVTCPILPVVVLGRFMTGLLSAIPAVVAAGSFENMWDITTRTFVIHTWIAGAILGLCIGPPVATFVATSSLRWPWVFIIAAIVAGVAAIFCFGMQESRPSQVIRQQVKAIERETSFDGLSLEGEDCLPTMSKFMRTSLWLPLRLFFTEPIVFLTSVMAATVVAVVYLFSEAVGTVYVEGFGFTNRQASLTMLAIAVGVLFAFLPRIYDYQVIALRKRQGRPLEPEDKLFGFLVAAPILAGGLWWFAWTVPPMTSGVSAWVSIASLVLIGFSTQEFDNLLSGYLCDTYATYAASANAPMAFLRAVLSGTFPLFGRQFFHKLGTNNALFISAGVATLYCGIAIVFSLYGKRVRERSSIAEKMWRASLSNDKLGLSQGSMSSRTDVSCSSSLPC